MRRSILLLAALLIPLPAFASPSDSLSGTDMIAELRSRRSAFAELLVEGTVVLLSTPSRRLFETRQEPNLYWLTGIEASRAALVVRVERREMPAGLRRARVVLDRITRLRGELSGLGRKARLLMQRSAPGAKELFYDLRKIQQETNRAEVAAAPLIREGMGPARISYRLYLPATNPRAARWDGPVLSAGPAAAQATGIEDVRNIRSLLADLGDIVPDGRLYLLGRTEGPKDLEEGLRGLRAERPDLFVRDPSGEFGRLRAVKSEEEVARIRKACELTCAGLRECMRSARPGIREIELQATLEYVCRKGGAVRQAFPSIMAAGPNALILHYRKNAGAVKDGDLVLMDVGGEVMGYASDVTRTFPVSGAFTKRQAEVYDVVLEAQAAGIAATRPGATLRDVGQAASQVIRAAGLGRGIRHGVSHHVGLDVHDPVSGAVLAPGMVFTIEPGIYLDDEGIGIRIEDTVVVTEDGVQVLSAAAPKTRKAIEALMKEKGVGDFEIK